MWRRALALPDVTIPLMRGPSDIVVVGGGVIGCAIAYELARRGASVEVVDERGAGMGATQASAGILAPYVEAESDAFLDLTVCSLNLFDELIARVSSDSGVAVPYRRCGTLQIAADAEQMAALARSAERLERRGMDF